MPFKSQAQRGFMYSQHPELAKEFEKATPKGEKLPEHVKKAEGGAIEDPMAGSPSNEPGVQDATTTDFLLPLLGAPGFSKAASALPEAADALGEAGEISLGGAAEEGAPKVEAFIKGVQKSPNGDINIYGVRGDPKEIAKLGYGEDPGSVPESVLQSKGILPPESQKPSLEANSLRDLWGRAAQEQSGTPTAAVAHYTRPDLVQRTRHMSKGGKVMKHYDDGGAVDSSTGDDSDWKDKLATVMKAMFNSPAASAAGAITDPIGSLASQLATPDSTVQNLGTAAVPIAQNVASSMTAGAVPQNTPPPPPSQPSTQLTPQSQTAANAVMPPDLEASMTPKPTPSPTVQPNALPDQSQKPITALDVLNKVTDGDAEKTQALLAQLKDHDTRAKFAQVLAIIGDGLSNYGAAKAGKEGTSNFAAELSKTQEQNRQHLLAQLPMQLAGDPNSQTSKMAQATLMQSMGIKPGDPRAAQIMKMPAQAITQLMPQMTDAVKNNIEKEKNLITAKQADVEAQNQALQRKNQAAELARQNKLAAATTAGTTLKDLSPMNPTNWGVLGQAKQALSGALGNNAPTQAPPMTATNKMGHKIVSHDGGRTWTSM